MNNHNIVVGDRVQFSGTIADLKRMCILDPRCQSHLLNQCTGTVMKIDPCPTCDIEVEFDDGSNWYVDSGHLLVIESSTMVAPVISKHTIIDVGGF